MIRNTPEKRKCRNIPDPCHVIISTSRQQGRVGREGTDPNSSLTGRQQGAQLLTTLTRQAEQFG
ncbi:hypothetical protein E2C01_063100 [Portunus trituberculatus]|uniref:Uncharacterized protein n=1 Tax=Portunus trituberculatus TaxID=210409 RepID=A0A5B7H9L3_PORTR|nr:hypothetical protein [Portunus trituberculatus]